MRMNISGALQKRGRNMCMPSRPVTIVDVARQAGVSKSLVSLAIRNDPGVSARTRQRILQVADELGYRSNMWARSLVRGQTQLIGVLLTDLRNAYHTDIVVGVEDAAAERDFHVVISHGRRDPALLASQLDSLVSLGVDGIVVISAHTPREALAQAVRTTPVVVVGRPADLPERVSQIRNDDAAGARLAVEHLLGLGHRRISYLQASGSLAARVRRDSYRETMEDAGLPGQVLEPDGFDAALASADRFTAVFASNDRGAAEALGQIHDAGLRVPADVAVVGYDDTDLARLMRPKLTSIGQPRLEMGRRALEIVCSGDVVREVFPPVLVPRSSTVG